GGRSVRGALSLGYFSLGKQREVTRLQGCRRNTQGREPVSRQRTKSEEQTPSPPDPPLEGGARAPYPSPARPIPSRQPTHVTRDRPAQPHHAGPSTTRRYPRQAPPPCARAPNKNP